MKRRTRVYPACCTSAFCGRIECEGCVHKQTLEDFRAWVKQHNAVQSCPVWSPNVYVANGGRG